jgi:hypothetical protein
VHDCAHFKGTRQRHRKREKACKSSIHAFFEWFTLSPQHCSLCSTVRALENYSRIRVSHLSHTKQYSEQLVLRMRESRPLACHRIDRDRTFKIVEVTQFTDVQASCPLCGKRLSVQLEGPLSSFPFHRPMSNHSQREEAINVLFTAVRVPSMP